MGDTSYIFMVNGFGHAAILKESPKGVDRLAGFTEDLESIEPGNASNTITATCEGSLLVMTVNGEEVLRVTDDHPLRAGSVSLVASNTEDERNIVSTFDDLTVVGLL
jgi:hypothetical protein